MKIAFPDVTLVMADTRCHELARMAVQDCMAQVDFGAVLICSDVDFAPTGTTYVAVKDWPNKDSAQEFLWSTVPYLVETSHFLFCEWDAWILNASYWRPEFLNYDFIGAPWISYPDHVVGNGGFSLSSTRRARHVAEHPEKYPVTHPFVWDTQLCRDYRPELEGEGFRFAPLELARQFSFETRHDNFDTFGFHAMFNWPMVLSGDRLRERARIARATPHVRNTQAQHLVSLPC